MLHALRHRRPLISAAAATRPLFTERLEERRLLVAPEVGAIGDVALPAGHAIQVPINGFDADGDALTYSVTSSTPALIPAFRDSGNTWIEMDVTWTDADDVARSGTMVYQLFDQATPVTVRTIRGFVESGFYDGLTFHRAVDGFTIQGGDAAGVGNGDVDNDGISDFTDILFEDELQPELLFSGEGQLAMANSGFDTNSTQFFVTFGPTRSLDYNHTIFGQLVRGFDVSDAISKVPVTANPLSFEQSFPVDPVTIVDARVVENTQDAVLQVRSDGTTGSGTLVVTATDAEGNQTSREVVVNVNEDLNNFNIENDQPPILGPLSDFRSAVGETIVLDIPAFDFEGDDFEIGGRFITQFEDENFPDNSILQTEKQITLTPRGGYVGPIEITVGVKQVNTTARGSTNENPNDTFNIFDKQTITIAVGDENLDATGTSLAAVPGTQVDGVVATFTHADPLSAADEFSALIRWGDASASEGTIVALGDGNFEVRGTNTYNAAFDAPVQVEIASEDGSVANVLSTVNVRETTDRTGSFLRIDGSDGDDTIDLSIVGQNLRVDVNGTINDFPSDEIGILEIRGYDGDDTINLGPGVPAAAIAAGAGNDVVDGGDFNDAIDGGPGNDFVFGDGGNDILQGNEGSDTLSGGAGKNTVNGNEGPDRVNGSGGRDLLFGGAGDDRLYGRGGDDTLDGGGGVDRLFGDELTGTQGNDFLIGGGSNDKLYGRGGDDTFVGNAGRDLQWGGDGNDTAFVDDEDETGDINLFREIENIV